MSENKRPTFYVTTPIYYVNDVPHIGHAYTTVIADALARFNRLRGRDVFFLTGTDEHGQKIEKAAAEKGLRPLELADRVVLRFKELWEALHISNDGFIRTTDPRHEQGVQKIFQALMQKGDIYKGTYQGWYCVSDENFLADDVPFQPQGDKVCPDCGKRAILVSEETYFFRLSKYQQPLLDFYAQHPEFVRPQSRLNEVVSFVRQGLRDLSITRTTVKWGIPVPGDTKHTIYVWFDALHNYLTGIGYDWDPERFSRFWPATIHLIGKDILRFHAVFWPAFLMASGLPLPETVFGHGWWLKDEAKMSKSKGNVLDPYQILKTFGADPLRYFLLREIPVGLDGNFSHEGFIHRVNSDLANDIGNLVHRTLTMIQGYFKGVIDPGEAEQAADRQVREAFDVLKERVAGLCEDYALNRALEEIWVYVNDVNKYLAANEPWKLAQDEARRPRLARILYQTAAAIRGLAYLVFPVMPDSCRKIWQFLGEPGQLEDVMYDDIKFDGLKPGQKIERHTPLFPRVVLEDFLKEEAAAPVQAPAAGVARPSPVGPAAVPGAGPGQGGGKKETKMDIVSFDEFKKMDLRVGEIIKAEKVPGTDKLLKIELNLGTEIRTMVAGVADTYAPEEIIGKKLIVIANLKPAVIRGIDSQAMLLAAEIGGKAIIPFFDRDVPAGAKVK
jgi:methionyl-tRNA synthetase